MAVNAGGERVTYYTTYTYILTLHIYTYTLTTHSMSDKTPWDGPTDAQLIKDWCDVIESRFEDQMHAVAMGEQDAITVNYADLFTADSDLARSVIIEPKRTLAHANMATESLNHPTPGAEDALADADVRVANVDTADVDFDVQPNVSELRASEHMGNYCGVRGQVSLASQVKPDLRWVTWECKQDGRTVGPMLSLTDEIEPPSSCPDHDGKPHWKIKESESERVDLQYVELTDPPGENPGMSGDSITVVLEDNLAGTVRPGDRVRVNAIVQTEHKDVNGGISTLEDWELTADAVDAEQKAFAEVEPERVDEIQRIAEEENVRQWFVDSFAPNILTGDRGDTHKLAVILSMFGGSGESGRSDINLFFIGAPGTGKSHYLERANELAPKSVMASGKGATAAGLTATATRHEKTGKWMLDAGALVLASGGLACIDEFDKMDNSARKSMHEAMENQRVPINKAGINTTLTTETAVIAAANPKHGSFERRTPVNEQVELGSPLLSRFDLIFGVYDSVDKDRDKNIAQHQQARARDTDEGVTAPMDDELITEYVAYARQNVNPTFDGEHSEAEEILVDYYVDKRQDSDGEDVMPVTPRMNDALRRIAQASARMHLRDTITVADAELATTMMDMTLGDTALDDQGNLDMGRKEGRNMTQEDRKHAIAEIIDDLDDGDAVSEDAILTEAQERLSLSPAKVSDELESMSTAGMIYEPRAGKGWVTT